MWRPTTAEVPTEVGEVYVLHFSRPFQHACHYIGWSKDAEARIESHRRGRGGNLMKHVVAAGISFEVAVIHRGVTRAFERQLKNRGGGARSCPICASSGKPGRKPTTKRNPRTRAAA